MRKLALYLGLVGALSVMLPAASGRADMQICNATEEHIFVMWVAPFSVCPTGFEFRLALLAISGCTVLDDSPSSQGRTFYYSAWSRAGGDAWRGNTVLWLPYEQIDRCMPTSWCLLTPDDAACRKNGQIHQMRSFTATTPSSTVNIRYEPPR